MHDGILVKADCLCKNYLIFFNLNKNFKKI